MRTLGVIAAGAAALAAAVGVLVGVRSLPDLRRYLRIRQM